MNTTAALGLAVMVVSEAGTLAQVEPFWSWNTPIAWTGFIVFADAVVYRARGGSWLRSASLEFLFLSLASIPLWLVFEFYNRFIENWYYVGLPTNPVLRAFGYAWSFATIWPAIFECAELVGVLRGTSGLPHATTTMGKPHVLFSVDPRARRPLGIGMALVGLALLVWPLVWPSAYLAAPVWLGFIFLLDPINVALGAQSLEGDFCEGQFDRLKNLLLSGLLCGALWEFWNYWARSKWHYTVPIMERLKLFEMPLPGYLGFPAFALECFTMYVFVRALTVRLTGRPFGRKAATLETSIEDGRQIGL